MTLRTKAEILAGIVFLALAFLYAKEWLSKHDALIQAQTQIQSDQQASQKIDAALKQRDEQYQKDIQAIQDAMRKLPSASSAQIAENAPKHIDLPAPIIISDANTTKPSIGSAIVPAEDIKPLAQAVLDGEKCKLDLAKCTGDLGDWQRKYELADDEGKKWQQAAKGGSVWQRVKHDAVIIGITAGAAYVAGRLHQ